MSDFTNEILRDLDRKLDPSKRSRLSGKVLKFDGVKTLMIQGFKNLGFEKMQCVEGFKNGTVVQIENKNEFLMQGKQMQKLRIE